MGISEMGVSVMKLNNNEVHTNRTALLRSVANTSVVNTLDAAKTSDEQIATMLDCAAIVLRRHSLFQQSPAFPFKLTNGNGMIHARINVPVPLKQVTEMNLQLAELIAEKMDDIPNGFHVTFKWVDQ
ncbi:hypothetical protein W822_19075 [Advenella kashmirensis W13003]|uniref:Uncharacterized protein n=1 Tax=Advenella kashmirensis W13003 TaxID=1424334 RepID=V8QQ29_9BURK|nr:hypothetical protein [Advenella kashmirensis]ETF01425.1 hypothetical protein W822_19075 [Advenella kashmirensis W13003]